MNTQKIQSLAASVYRREFEKSQYRAQSYADMKVNDKKTSHPNEGEFELELARALEGFEPKTLNS